MNKVIEIEKTQDGTFECRISTKSGVRTGRGRTELNSLMDVLSSKLSETELDMFLRWYRKNCCKWETAYHFVTEHFDVYGWVGVTSLKIWRSTEYIHTPWVVDTKDFDYRKGLISTIPTPSTRDLLEEFLMSFIKKEIQNYR